MVTIARTAHAPLEGRVEGLPREIDLLVDKCLAKEREGRFESANALADAIDAILARFPLLPTADLGSIVVTPEELHPDDARTIATIAHERSAGTLAATELEKGAAAPSSASLTPVKASASTTDRRSVAPAFRTRISKRVRVGASIAGGVLLIAIALVATRKHDEPAPAAAAQPAVTTPIVAAPAPTPSAESPKETVAPPAPEPSPSAAPSATAPTSVPTTNVAVHKQPAKPATKPAAPKPTAKPPHEGVTGAGF
jgi:hypothetical protein